MRRREWIAILMGLLGLCGVAMGALPDPAKGGKGGGPIDLLLIRGHSEWAFGEQPKLDAKYQEMLKDRGYRVTTTHEWQALTPEFLKQFNVAVYLNPSAYLGGGYIDMTGWRSGYHLLTVRTNLTLLQQWVREGGGLFIVPALEEVGMRTTYSLNDLLAPYGLETECACVRDTARAFKAAASGFCSADYPWTEAVSAHPVTEGVKRIYYPSYCTRWDDNYTTIPLKAKDSAWTMAVKAMPGSRSEMRRGSIYDDKGDWTALEGWDEPGLFGVREFGKGRVAVTGLSGWHLFLITYAKSGDVTESSFSRVDGIPMSEGDGKTKSDLHVLLDNTYRWLAEPSLKAGLGGFDSAKGVVLPPEDHSKDETMLSDVWNEKDPMVTGPVRPIKILVGARSAASNGKGTPEDWAKAAKKAGYDVVCFTEPFEFFKHDQWEQYVADCRKYSDGAVTLVPGYDMDTDLGNRFLLVGVYQRVRPHLLTPDRKKMFWTGHMVLGMGDVLPVAARPQQLATVRGAQGALPPDLYSHLVGVAVETYEVDKPVDDGLFAYQWLVYNATIPHPVAVHEVSSPDQLAAAAGAGLQNYINSDTPEHAAFYYRLGQPNFGGNPARYYVSSGPLFDDCRMDNWQAPGWNVTLKAHGPRPISEILVNDQQGVYRRFTPAATNAEVRWSGDQGRQHWFVVELRDAQGGRAYLSAIRSLPLYYFIRCMDRQNFFGMRMPWLTYIGKAPASKVQIEVPGVKLAQAICYKPQMFYAGYLYGILDFDVGSTYVPAGDLYVYETKTWGKGGRQFRADNAPVFNDMPIPEYWARMRDIHYRSRSYRQLISPPAFVDEEGSIRLKMDLKSSGNVWPIIGRTTAKADYRFTDAKGQKVAGKVETFVDLPEGGWAGDIVALSPLRVGADGAIGFPPPADGLAKSGTVYRGVFTKIEATNAPAILKSMGLDGLTPYTLDMRQGKVNRIVATIHFDADKGGVAGHLTGAAIPDRAPRGWEGVNPGYDKETGIPLQLHGANPRWVAGLWTSVTNIVEPYGFLDGVALGLLRVDKDTDFYFGNLLTASDTNLNLAFGAEWTKDCAVIEVNNPTARDISATVRSAEAVKDRKAVKEKVKVPAGSSVYVTVK